MRFTPASSAAWIVRMARSSSGRPSIESGIPPRPIGKTWASPRARLGVMPEALPEPHVARRHVVAQALVGRLAQRAGLRALGELDAGDEARLDEARELRRLAADERALDRLERLQHAAEPHQLGLVEAGADAAGVTQHAIVVGDADDERAEPAGAVA